MRKDSFFFFFFFFFWETAPWTRGGATIPLKFQQGRLHQRPLGLPQSKYKKDKNYKLLLLSYELLCYPAYVYVWKLSAWNVRIGPWCQRECDQSSLQRSSRPSWPFMAMSESPSRMIWSKPSSCAKERARLVANTSTISTEVGNGITCVNAAITRPWSLRMMAPRPASSFSWKMVPSKLIFTQSEGGGSHLVWIRVGGVDDTGERILILWNTLLSTN